MSIFQETFKVQLVLQRLHDGSLVIDMAEGRMKMQMLESQNNRNGKNHSDAKCQLVANSGSQEEEARKVSTQLIAKPKHGVSGSVSGNRAVHYYYFSGNS